MDLIGKYFSELTDLQKDRFNKLGRLYTYWNEKINVVSRKDIDQIYLRHILHSLAIARYIQFKPNTSILDVGTGGGFPGIPLAILFPECKFLLVDSIGKKIKVVNAISEELKLENCNGIQTRAEQVKGRFDFVVSRAVTSLPVFVQWVEPLINKKSQNSLPNGILYLKGGDITEELNIPYNSQIIDISTYFDEPFFETKKIVHVLMSSSEL